MKIASIFLMVIMLSACSTPETLRKHVPNLDLSSKKSAKDVAVCVATKWETSSIYLVNFRPTVTGFQITVMNIVAGHIDNMVDIEEMAAGSTTKHYSIGIPEDRESFAARVVACQ